jgi:hypothetical protein
MKKPALFLSLLLLSSASELGSAPVDVGGLITKVVAIPGSNYCHLKFPAIVEDTLYRDRPVLKDPSEGDIIDFYGPCDYDPLGREEIERQRAEVRRRLLMDSDPE